MRIIAIDPGYERIGIAVLEKSQPVASTKGYGGLKEKLIFSECFKTKASLPFIERLELIGRKIEQVIKEFKPEALVIENLFISTNQKTAMRVAEARGAILYQARILNLPVYEYTPLQIKTATTSYGKATKKQVGDMVKRIIPEAKTLKQDDEIDALAVGITHFAYTKTFKKQEYF